VLALLAAVAVAQAPAPAQGAPTVGLFLRPGPEPVRPALRETVLDAVRTGLAEAGLPVTLDAREADRRLRRAKSEACPAGLECLYKIGRALGVDVLVAVGATEFEGDVAVALEAVSPSGSRRLARHSAVVPSGGVARRLPDELEPFVRELRSAVGPAPDAPVATRPPSLTPSSPPKAAPAPLEPAGPSRVPSYVAGGAAAAAGGAAILFLVSGLGYRSLATRQETPNESAWEYGVALGYQEKMNRNYTYSLAAAGASAALTGAALLLWPREATAATGFQPRADR
jgi:hypothetical protein